MIGCVCLRSVSLWRHRRLATTIVSIWFELKVNSNELPWKISFRFLFSQLQSQRITLIVDQYSSCRTRAQRAHAQHTYMLHMPFRNVKYAFAFVSMCMLFHTFLFDASMLQRPSFESSLYYDGCVKALFSSSSVVSILSFYFVLRNLRDACRDCFTPFIITSLCRVMLFPNLYLAAA